MRFYITWGILMACIFGLAYAAEAQEEAVCENLSNSGHTSADCAVFEMWTPVLGAIEYRNRTGLWGAGISEEGTWTLEQDGVSCDIEILVGDWETVYVTCLPPFTAAPAAPVYIMDGENYTFIVSMNAS